MEIFSSFLIGIIRFVVLSIVFVSLAFVIKKIVVKLKDRNTLNLSHFFPEDEIHTLWQIFYLLIMTAMFVYIVASLILLDVDSYYLAIYDFIISMFCVVTFERTGSKKDKLILLFLIPFASYDSVLGDYSFLFILDILHYIVFVYLIRLYYKKFMKYTTVHGLGIAILLLYFIILISVFSTYIFEGVNLLDAFVMSSNAFTSNGYSILGTSIMGKINSIFLVWSGYIISGVSTATLTAAILIKHFNKRFEALEELIKNQNDEK